MRRAASCDFRCDKEMGRAASCDFRCDKERGRVLHVTSGVIRKGKGCFM
jgi:hypothetical protein